LKGREWLAEDTKNYNIYERKIMELQMLLVEKEESDGGGGEGKGEGVASLAWKEI